MEWINKRIPEHTAQVYKQAFQELFDNCCHRLQDVPQKYTDQIQGPKTVEIINESDTNLLYLHDNTMFLEDMWDYHPIGQICIASQLLRHRELLTTNQFNIPSHQHTAFLYAGAIEMINQIYEGGMQRAFTTDSNPEQQPSIDMLCSKACNHTKQKKCHQPDQALHGCTLEIIDE